MIIAEFMLVYYGTNSAGFDYTFSEALNMFQKLLINNGQFQKELTIGAVILFGFNFVPAILSFKKDLKMEEGFLVDDAYYENAKKLKRSIKLRTGALIAFIFIGLFGLVRHITLGVDYDYIYVYHHWLCFIVFWLLSFIVHFFLVQTIPCLRNSIGSVDYQPINRKIKFFEVSIYSFALATWLLALANYINLEFKSKTSKSIGIVTNLESNIKTNDYFFDFKSDEYPLVYMNVRESEQPYLINNTKVEVTIKEGYLGSPFITNVNFLEVNNYKSAIKLFESEEELRNSNIKAFLRYDGSDHFKKKLKEWEKQCQRDPDYTCRLASYAYGHNNEIVKKIEYLKIGCADGDDPVSCYGYFFEDLFNNNSKENALEKLRSGCNEKKADHCLYLAYALRKIDHPKYHRKIKELIEKGAALKMQ